MKVWNTQKKIFLDVLSIGQSKLRESRRDNKILEKKLDKIQAENEKLEQNLKDQKQHHDKTIQNFEKRLQVMKNVNSRIYLSPKKYIFSIKFN